MSFETQSSQLSKMDGKWEVYLCNATYRYTVYVKEAAITISVSWRKNLLEDTERVPRFDSCSYKRELQSLNVREIDEGFLILHKFGCSERKEEVH